MRVRVAEDTSPSQQPAVFVTLLELVCELLQMHVHPPVQARPCRTTWLPACCTSQHLGASGWRRRSRRHSGRWPTARRKRMQVGAPRLLDRMTGNGRRWVTCTLACLCVREAHSGVPACWSLRRNLQCWRG